MMKLLCITLPHFVLRCELSRRPALAGQPAVIVYSLGSKKLVLDFSPDLIGLQPDMALQEAQSLGDAFEFIPADMAHYRSVFNGLLDAVETKSPLVEGKVLGDIYVGCDGLHKLYGSDEGLVDAVRSVIPDEFQPRFGLGDGKFTAYLAAAESLPGGFKSLAGAADAAFAALSCDLLPVDPGIKSKLHEFGLHTFGRVAALGLAQLQAQFGPDGARIWRLCRGQDDTPLEPRLSEEEIEESTSLPSATVSQEVMLMALEPLLQRAFRRFGSRGMGIRCIRLWTRTWLKEHWEQSIHFKEPAMTVRAVLARLKPVLENCAQPGPVEQLGMVIKRLSYPVGRQENIFTDVRSEDKLLDDVRQLELRFGAPQIYRMKEIEPWSRIPERRYVLTPLGR
jgi:DNA polymerase-4/protein ImuB